MLTLTELMEPSIRTFSFSFLLMVTGCSRSSLLLLRTQNDRGTIKEQNGQEAPWQVLESLSGTTESKEWDSQAGVLQDGGQRACSPAERAQALESGWKVLKFSLLCYFHWASYPVGISTSSFGNRSTRVKCVTVSLAHCRSFTNDSSYFH